MLRFLTKIKNFLINKSSHILIIFVLISYTLLGPLNVNLPIFGTLKPYHIALSLASIIFSLIIISSFRSMYRDLPMLVIKFCGLYFIFLIVITISMFRGFDLGKSYSLWRNYVANLLLVILVALTIRHETQITAVLYVLIGVTTVGAILGGLQAAFSPKISIAYFFLGESWFMEHGSAPVGYAHMPYKFGNDMLVGFLPALAFLLGHGLSTHRPNHVRFLVLLLIVAVILGGLFLSLGLTSLMGSAIGAIYIAHKLDVFKNLFKKKFFTFVLFLISSAGLMFSPEIIAWFINTYTAYQGIITRWHLALASIHMLQTSPFLGVGLGNFSVFAREYFLKISFENPEYFLKVLGGTIATAPHNIFLEILAENGIIGLILYLSIWWYAFYVCSLSDTIKSEISDLRVVGVGLKGALIGYMIDALFHNYTFDNHLWLIIGLCLAVGNLSLRLNE